MNVSFYRCVVKTRYINVGLPWCICGESLLQLVRRRRQNPLNDTGLVRSTLGRCLDVKPSLQSSGIEPDLSPNEQIIDSKEWFKIKQEVPETPQQLNQDKVYAMIYYKDYYY